MVPTFNYIHITITLVPLTSPVSTGMTNTAAVRFLTPDSPAHPQDICISWSCFKVF